MGKFLTPSSRLNAPSAGNMMITRGGGFFSGLRGTWVCRDENLGSILPKFSTLHVTAPAPVPSLLRLICLKKSQCKVTHKRTDIYVYIYINKNAYVSTHRFYLHVAPNSNWCIHIYSIHTYAYSMHILVIFCSSISNPKCRRCGSRTIFS